MDTIPNPEEAGSRRGSSHSPKSPGSSSKKKSSKPSGQPQGKRTALQEARRKGRMDRSRGEEEMTAQLRNLDLGSKLGPSGTGLAFTEIFTHYSCLWDSSHVECPARVSTIMEKAQQQGLVSRCVRVEPRAATDQELLLVHAKEYVELMKSTQTMSQEELKTLSDTYDSVYIHPESFRCARLAVGSLLQLVDEVMASQLRNGFSVARPPGHHAHVDKMSGYCMFNSVAIAARYARERHGLERILIVDWDVHHGQGIQYIFQEDPSVLCFSVHRYEDGRFWPHLVDSDRTAAGKGAGRGYNINVPWNQVGMKDADYIAAFQQLLLPVAYQFQPQLVLVAAGFDSVIGDPKGEMAASPQCFSVLTHLLQGLAQGRVLLALEGGYNLQSTAEGACACLRSLLGDPCPRLATPGAPCDSALQSLSQTIAVHYPSWSSLQVLEGGPIPAGDPDAPSVPPEASVGQEVEERPPMVTGLVYDERMMEHHNMWDSHHPELPQRIFRIFSRHQDLGLLSRCHRIPARRATEEELAMCHSSEHIATIRSTQGMKPRELHRLGAEYNSIYISPESWGSARLAAGAGFSAAQAVLAGQVRNAVAIVRPPGHHAERGSACGFCFFNNAALTARYAQKLSGRPLRVLILDWDVHHGNGTQHIFEEDPSVLYISLHRYDDGLFFPSSEDADCDRVGLGPGRGHNVNIPWSGGGAKMGDPEYLAAFHWVVMPIARQFCPELVLVSAGFDAARGDPLGGYQVTPECYAHITHLLMSLAGGRVLVILEGGYNLNSISESMASCTSALLGDGLPPLAGLPPPHPSAARTINRVLRAQAPYWSCLKIQLPETLRASLPSLKQQSRRSAEQKGKRSPGQAATPRRSPRLGSQPATPEQGAVPVSPPERGSEERGGGVQDITQGLLMLDLDTPSSSPANPSPTSLPVGGARRKAKPAPLESSDVISAGGERSDTTPQPTLEPTEGRESGDLVLKVETCEVQAATRLPPGPVAEGDQEARLEGACGGSSQVVCEVFCPDQGVAGASMFVVEPLPWCPHLEGVRPLPAGGIDVLRPCEDCGAGIENWLCLTCHQVLHEARNAAHCAKFGEGIPRTE
ncbi:HDAC6 deacetylase, partial [Atractosteus spatula]|nr:HDAC6 deacetylase [Atractosteus spatula]